MMIGGFFEAHCHAWTAEDRLLFGALLDEQDVDHHVLGDRNPANT